VQTQQTTLRRNVVEHTGEMLSAVVQLLCYVMLLC
jgi:hypothetical protein